MDNMILSARELRWNTRMHLAQSHFSPILSVTLRAPHTLRNEPCFIEVYRKLCLHIEKSLKDGGQPLHLLLQSLDAEGPACHYAVKDALAAKRLSIAFEEEALGGALLDIDVMDEKMQPLSRRDLGLAARACLVCKESEAAVCITGKKHPPNETEKVFRVLAQRCLNLQDNALFIARCAVQSLLYEVSVTPKPGLVDRINSGAHGDMDYDTFLRSTAALAPYFLKAANLGRGSAVPPQDLLALLRPFGVQAEAEMMRATGGVNTHRGLIFSLGILCAASAGVGDWHNPDRLCELAAEIAKPALLSTTDGGHGARVRGRCGAGGARAEAAAGFPAVREALPILTDALTAGSSPDAAGLSALLFIMGGLNDTNVLYRAGVAGLRFVQQNARSLYDRNIPEDELETFCREMKTRGISPGGSADCLALCFFLYSLQKSS